MNSFNVWVNKLNNCFDSADREVILYGAGYNAASLIIQLMYNYSDINVICVVDADVGKHGEDLFGIPIVAPENLAEYSTKTCIIVTPDKSGLAITNMLNSFGFYNILYSYGANSLTAYVAQIKSVWLKENREYIEVLMKDNADKIKSVRNLLEHDSKSLAVFDAKIESSFFGQHIPLENLQEGDQYFPKDIISLRPKEVFVDCGAYDGGTTLDFIRRVPRRYGYMHSYYAYALEPDPSKYKLTKTVLEFNQAKNYDVFNVGAYEREGETSFERNSYGGKISTDGDVRLPVTTLDALLYDKPKQPTFIKMDIEGAELQALRGAYNIIKRNKPTLAVCVYHGDPNLQLWEVPLWINENFPDYNLYMRQHLSITETVCYAVVK